MWKRRDEIDWEVQGKSGQGVVSCYCWDLFIYIYSSSAPTGVGRSCGAPEQSPPLRALLNPMFGT